MDYNPSVPSSFFKSYIYLVGELRLGTLLQLLFPENIIAGTLLISYKCRLQDLS